MTFNSNDWQNSFALTIDNTLISGTLINFPVAIALSSSTGITDYDVTAIFDTIGVNNKKIAITTVISEVETELYVEIEFWDTVSEMALLWTKVPTVYSGIDTQLKLYYDNTQTDNNYVDPNIKLLIQDSFQDYSTSEHTITVGGDPELSVFNANENPLMNNSARFNGTNAYLTIPNSVITTSTSTFTVEAWLYLDSSVTVPTHSSLIGDSDPGSNSSYWSFGPDDEDKLIFRWWDGISNVAQSTNTINLNEWVHLAVSVNSNNIKLFINGVEETIVGTSTLTNRSSTLNYLTIGASNNYYIDSSVSLIRITDTYEYSTRFTPPRSYTSDTNTKLLINFTESGWGQGATPATFVESGNSGYTVTNNSSNVVGSTFWWGRVLNFDGTGDFLSIPTHSDLIYGSGNFTISFWVKLTTNARNYLVCHAHASSDSDTQFLIYTNPSSLIGAIVYVGSTGYAAGFNTALTTDRWYHIAAVRSGTVFALYVDGVVQATTANVSSLTLNTPITDMTIGYRNVGTSTDALDGYITDVKCIKGVALYTDNFTPPSQPTSIGYVGNPTTGQAMRVWDEHFAAVYHMSQDPSGGSECILDSTFNSNHGTPEASMGSEDLVSSLTGSGIAFNGTTDYITIPETMIDSLTGLTVESFAYVEYSSTNVTIVSDAVHYNDDVSLNFAIKPQSSYVAVFDVFESTTVFTRLIDSDIDFDSTKYNYIAGTFTASNYIRLYRNGIEKDNDTTSVTQIKNENNNFYIGRNGYGGGANYYKGIIDDVRISTIERPAAWMTATNHNFFNQLITFTASLQQTFYFDGYVTLRNKAVSRQLNLHRRDTGALVGTTTSSGNGYYYIETPYNNIPHYLVCFDDAAGENFNDLIRGNIYPYES